MHISTPRCGVLVVDKFPICHKLSDPQYHFGFEPERTFVKSGVPCPDCGSTLSEVMETRTLLNQIRRRRRCFNEHLFTTYEQVAKPTRAKKRKKAQP